MIKKIDARAQNDTIFTPQAKKLDKICDLDRTTVLNELNAQLENYTNYLDPSIKNAYQSSLKSLSLTNPKFPDSLPDASSWANFFAMALIETIEPSGCLKPEEQRSSRTLSQHAAHMIEEASKDVFNEKD